MHNYLCVSKSEIQIIIIHTQIVKEHVTPFPQQDMCGVRRLISKASNRITDSNGSEISNI